MRFLDLFSGIGGFRLGMEKAGHTCVGYVELDKHARKSYQNMHNIENEWTREDIMKVEEDEIYALKERGVDIICGGFPCQAFSIAGKRRGMEDTRGTLFFDIARFAEIIKPRYLFLENVKGLLSHDGGKTFEVILKTLDVLGYDVEWQVCNSKDFGVAQNRERVLIVGHLRGEHTEQVFPIAGENHGTSCEMIGILNIKGLDQMKRVYSPDGLCPTLTTMGGGNTHPKIGVKVRTATKLGYETAYPGDRVDYAYPNSQTRRGRVGKIAQTLVTSPNQGVFTEDYDIRRLTPRECFRLQGFPDELFEKAQEVNSDSQLYKQAGNSVTVNVIYEIAKCLV